MYFIISELEIYSTVSHLLHNPALQTEVAHHLTVFSEHVDLRAVQIFRDESAHVRASSGPEIEKDCSRKEALRIAQAQTPVFPLCTRFSTSGETQRSELYMHGTTRGA